VLFFNSTLRISLAKNKTMTINITQVLFHVVRDVHVRARKMLGNGVIAINAKNQLIYLSVIVLRLAHKARLVT
jgi:hypothetical protein